MLNMPILRWGQPYTSLEQDDVIHFITGETLAQGQPGQHRTARPRHAPRAARARGAGGDSDSRTDRDDEEGGGSVSVGHACPWATASRRPDDFARQQSASTGLPEHMCKGNMKKNHFVLSNMDQILDALTRGLRSGDSLARLRRESRGVMVSYQAQSPVLGLVLPSNSPGVHTLWLPVIPMQIGLVLKPGPQEPWTPYRMAAAFFERGRAQGGDLDLSRRRGRRRGSGAAHEPLHDFRRHRDGRALQRRPARAGARAGLQQDPARRRRGGPAGRSTST